MREKVGDRLRMFRLSRAMSLDELAAATSGRVTKQAISKYERGLMSPSPLVLKSLARVFGVKASEMLASPLVNVEVLAYRRTSRLTKKEQNRVESLVSRMLERRVVLQEAYGQINGSSIPLAKYSPKTLEECEEIADDLRAMWSLGADPIACVTDVLEERHIHVMVIETEADFDGLAVIARDGSKNIKAVGVVSRKGVDGERQRLNLSHELGHLAMTKTDHVDEEKAAFRFGAAFLAPADLVRKDVGTKRRKISLFELGLLKKKYGMSIQALIYRLTDLDIIGNHRATQLWKEISARGWKKKEPWALEAEDPQWSRRAALRAVAEGALTLEKAEEIMGVRFEEPVKDESTARRDLLKLPPAERGRLLTIEAQHARNHYLEDDEWISLLGGDLLPDE
jgi:Zn-dependent peptidase ImmA (M78 family)/DNA-binding XRE family transcriptional regulator